MQFGTKEKMFQNKGWGFFLVKQMQGSLSGHKEKLNLRGEREWMGRDRLGTSQCQGVYLPQKEGSSLNKAHCGAASDSFLSLPPLLLHDWQGDRTHRGGSEVQLGRRCCSRTQLAAPPTGEGSGSVSTRSPCGAPQPPTRDPPSEATLLPYAYNSGPPAGLLVISGILPLYQP